MSKVRVTLGSAASVTALCVLYLVLVPANTTNTAIVIDQSPTSASGFGYEQKDAASGIKT